MGCGQSQDARPLSTIPQATPTESKSNAEGANQSNGTETRTPGPNTAPSTANNTEKDKPQASVPSKSSSSNSVGPPRVGPPIPVSILTDSYKASHFLMYPDAKLMVAYGEFRGSFNKDPDDSRFVFYGIRYIIENFVAVQWTERDVQQAELFYSTHNAGFQPYPFPKDLFLKFVHENRGYMPVKIEALQEGTVANVHVPVYQIFASDEYSRLITFLETILTQVWYPSTVATLSRRTKDLIEIGFEETADVEDNWQIDYKLHDFGFRGCTCVEQSILGGTAHLLNFNGSDTMSACYYAQFYLNDGKPVATSIPATEHSVMTSWPNERLAMENMIDKFGGPQAVFAIVCDSYDYNNCLTKVLPAIAQRHKDKGGVLVVRPDSGDPVECILSALEAGEANFPTVKNKKGFKVIQGMAAIQGDGINYNTVRGILNATKAAGFSAQNVAFGMGGGLLQKVNRDTMSFATKLSYIVYKDGTDREVMKRPKTESNKISLPGILKVRRDGGKLIVEPRTPDEKVDYSTNELKLVYDYGPVEGCWDSFTVIKERVKQQWHATPKLHDPVGPGMKDRIKKWIVNFDGVYDTMMAQIDSDLAKIKELAVAKAAASIATEQPAATVAAASSATTTTDDAPSTNEVAVVAPTAVSVEEKPKEEEKASA